MTSRTVYVGLGATGKSLYERTTTGSTVKHVHFIYAGAGHGGNAFRAADPRRRRRGDREQVLQLRPPRLGDRDERRHGPRRLVADRRPRRDGAGLRRLGRAAQSDGTAANPASFNLPPGNREFTGQEQIPNVGLVNMNGRLYDPSLGRFLSPDPNVQFVADLQSYNRYAYVANNPLRYTDPTGYFSWDDVGGFFKKTFGNPLTDFEIGASLVVCAGSGAACIVAGLLIAGMNVGIAVANGAGFGQTIALTLLGMGIGVVTGGAAGGGLVGLLVGTASAAVTTGISNVVAGRAFFGYDMLGAAFLSAAQGAASLGLQQVIAASQASIGRAWASDPQGAGVDDKQRRGRRFGEPVTPARQGRFVMPIFTTTAGYRLGKIPRGKAHGGIRPTT